MQPILVCFIRPTDLSGRLSGGLRRFVEVASRIDVEAVKYVIIESEPFLKSFPYFTGIREVTTKHTILGFHMPWQACMNRRVLAPILFWLNIAIVAFVEAKVAKATQASLVLAPGETLPEALATWVCSKITGRRGVVVVQSDPFLSLGQRQLNNLKACYAAYRTMYHPLAAFIEAFTARLFVRAMNEMRLLVLGRNLLKVLATRGIVGVATRQITDGVDLEKVRAAKPLRVLYDVIFAGRIDPSKGIMEFLHAWTESLENCGKFRVALVGPVQERLRAELQSFTASYHKCIDYLGTMTDIGVISLLKSSRVLVLPSFFESFSLIIAEALASGIPVVCFDSPSIREFFTTSAVCLVPSRNMEGLVKKVRELLEDEEERLRLAGEGIAFASRYNWADIAALEARIYRDFASEALNRRNETAPE
jgi:glycosyltransferase involved in cell wall biosynthesis